MCENDHQNETLSYVYVWSDCDEIIYPIGWDVFVLSMKAIIFIAIYCLSVAFEETCDGLVTVMNQEVALKRGFRNHLRIIYSCLGKA